MSKKTGAFIFPINIKKDEQTCTVSTAYGDQIWASEKVSPIKVRNDGSHDFVASLPEGTYVMHTYSYVETVACLNSVVTTIFVIERREDGKLHFRVLNQQTLTY